MVCLEELPEDIKRIPTSAVDSSNFPKDLFEMHRLSTAFLNKGELTKVSTNFIDGPSPPKYPPIDRTYRK